MANGTDSVKAGGQILYAYYSNDAKVPLKNAENKFLI